MFRSLCVVPNVVLKNTIRNYVRKRTNPGLDHTVKVLQDEGVILSPNEVDLDFIDDSEADFNQINKMEEQHSHQVKKMKAFLPKHIVGQKYFSENTPNLLTWSEKEQIRYLHNKDPDEWTLEKISESFPVTVEAAKKILKVVWKPASQNRINRHDASALRNWKELQDGTLENIDPKMREHFLKFTNRTLPPRPQENLKETLLLSEKISDGEYSQLLQIRKDTEKKFNEINAKNDKKYLNSKSVSDLTIQTSQVKSPSITLDKLREKITQQIENNETVSELDKHLVVPQEKNESLNDDPQLKASYLSKPIKGVTSVDKFSADEADKVVEIDFTKRIRIPKNLYKRDGTYKLSDCFYDSDGTFLYRVPGLVNNFSNVPKENSEETNSSN